MATFWVTIASPFFLNCREMTVSSGSDSIPSNWSVAPRAAVLTASLLPLVNSFIGMAQSWTPSAAFPGVTFSLSYTAPAPRKDKRENVASGGYPLAVLAANSDCEVDFIHYAEPVGAVRGVNLLRRRRISKRNHKWTRI